MTARTELLTLIAAGAVIAGCDSRPLGVAEAGAPGGVATAPSLAAGPEGMSKTAISGTIANLAGGNPGRLVVTPSGRCHFFDLPVTNVYSGDIVGTVTFHESNHAACDFSDLVGSGPFDGTVTWNGRTGMISGQWTTNCNADLSQPIGLSCDGTTNARGSGGLEGVQFHTVWGPGWYPFAYTGTAFAQ